MEGNIKRERSARGKGRIMEEPRTDVKDELLDNAQKHLRTGKRGRERKGKKPKSTRALFLSPQDLFVAVL